MVRGLKIPDISCEYIFVPTVDFGAEMNQHKQYSDYSLLAGHMAEGEFLTVYIY